MASSIRETRPASPGIAGRRSTRLAIAIPIAISGKDAAGNSFKENSRTVVINKHGAKILTVRHLSLGTELVVENRALGLSARTNVVWIADRKSPKDAVEIGVQLLEAANIWGIEFPPEDWAEGAPIGLGGERLETTGLAPAPIKPPEIARPQRHDEKQSGPATQLGAVKPVPTAPGVRDAGGSRAGQVEQLRPAPSPPPLSPTDTSALLEAALVRFSQRAEAAADEQVKSFAARLAKLTNQVGIQTQTTLQNSAAELQDKMVKSLDEQIGSVLDRLQSSRTELDALLTRFQELQQSSEAEVEKTQRNIHEAGWQAVQAATEQLSEKFQQQMETVNAGFMESTSKRIQDEASSALASLTQEATGRLATLLDNYVSKSVPEIQARQADALAQTKEQISEVAQFTSASTIDGLQKQANELLSSFQTQLEKSLTEFKDKSLEQASDHLRKTAKDSGATAAEELRKQANDARRLLTEEVKAAGKGMAEESRKQLAVLTNDTVDKLNESAKAGVAEFQGHVQQGLHEVQEKSAKELERHQAKVEHAHIQLDKALAGFQEKGARELESHFQKSAARHREDLLKQLQRETDEATERAVAEVRAKIDLSVKESSETVNRVVASAAVFLGAIEEKTRVNLEGHARNCAESARSAAEAGEKQLAEISQAAAQTIRSSTETLERLAKEFEGRAQGSARAFQAQIEDLPRVFHEKIREEVAALEKQSGETEARAKASLDNLQAQMRDVSKAAIESVSREFEVLLESLRKQMEEAAGRFEAQNLEAILSRLRSTTDKLADESAALLAKQAEENVILVAEKLNEQKEAVVNEAGDALRAKLAEMFSTVLQPRSSRATEQDPTEPETGTKRR